jgi:TetR/AcrR family transcriptional regulator
MASATRKDAAAPVSARATRDPEGTKRRILEAALDEFAAKGLDGARVDGIAARAGVNKRMLYYYFGSKDDLYRAVLRRRLAERAPTGSALDHTGPDRLAALQDRLTRPREREYIRLLTWEAIERGSRRRIEDETSRREAIERWIDEVRDAQDDGVLPADLDPAQLVLSELALTIFPLAFPQLTRLVTGRSPSDPHFVEARREFLSQLARRIDRTPGRSRADQ